MLDRLSAPQLPVSDSPHASQPGLFRTDADSADSASDDLDYVMISATEPGAASAHKPARIPLTRAVKRLTKIMRPAARSSTSPARDLARALLQAALEPAADASATSTVDAWHNVINFCRQHEQVNFAELIDDGAHGTAALAQMVRKQDHALMLTVGRGLVMLAPTPPVMQAHTFIGGALALTYAGDDAYWFGAVDAQGTRLGFNVWFQDRLESASPRHGFELQTWHGECVDGRRAGLGSATGANFSLLQGLWHEDRLIKGAIEFEAPAGDGVTCTHRFAGSAELTGPRTLQLRTGHLSDGRGTSHSGTWDGNGGGSGTSWFADGSMYRGSWRTTGRMAPQAWGAGELTDAAGSYKGSFVNGQRSGRGIQVYSDGSTYEGRWLQGKRCGVGTRKLGDGRIFVGEFVDDAPRGSFRLLTPDRRMREVRFDGVSGEPECL